MAAALSARARAGLGVSMPVAWDELAGLTSAAHWTIADVEARRAEVARRDPCAAHDSVHPTLTRANKLLSGTW